MPISDAPPVHLSTPSRQSDPTTTTDTEIDADKDRVGQASRYDTGTAVDDDEEVVSSTKSILGDPSRLFMKTVSYLLLCLSSTQIQMQLPGRGTTGRVALTARQITQNSLAQTPVWSMPAQATRMFEKQLSKMERQRSSLIPHLKQEKTRKHRFRRKGRRKVLRETFLSKLENFDRDLTDKEFAALLKDLSQSPFKVEDYEERFEIEVKNPPRGPTLLFHPFPDWMIWTQGDEEVLSDFEQRLLRESTDDWIISQVSNSHRGSQYDDSDVLTEGDLWILRNSACRRDVEPTSTSENDIDDSGSITIVNRAMTRRMVTGLAESARIVISWFWKSVVANRSKSSEGTMLEEELPSSVSLKTNEYQEESSQVGTNFRMRLGESASDTLVHSLGTKSRLSRNDRPPSGFHYVRDD